MITERGPNGETLVLTSAGWRPISEQERTAQETPRWQAFLAEGIRGYNDLWNLLGAGTATLYGRPEVAQQELGKMQQRALQFKALETMQPGATAAGMFWGDPANIASAGLLAARGLQRGASAAVRAGAGEAAAPTGRMADRVAASIAERSAAARSAGAAAESVPGGSVGAASTTEGIVRRMIRAPRQLFDDIGRAVDEFLAPEDLTPTQQALLPTVDRLGFQLLPGQREGASGLRRLAKSDPVIEAAFAPELQANLAGLRRAAARSIGYDTPDLTRDLLGDAAERLGTVFNSVGDDIGRIELSDDLVQRIAIVGADEKYLQIAVPKAAAKAGEEAAPQAASLTGRQAMQLRSSMSAASSAAWRAGRDAPAGKADFIDLIVNELDDLIEAQLSAESRAAWRLARQQWKNLKVLEATNVLGKSGEINPLTLANRLTRMYPGAYGRQLTGEAGRRAGLTPETVELMDWASVATAFADNFPNSGTPARTRLIEVLTNPRELAKSVLLRQAIEARLPPPPP